MTNRLRIVLSLSATLLLVIAVIAGIPRADLIGAFKSYHRADLICFISLSVFALFVRAYRYHLMLSAMNLGGSLPTYGQLLVTTGIRNAFVDFLPARLGEISYVIALRRYGVDLISAVSSFALCLVLDIAVLLAILVVLFLVFVVADPYLPAMFRDAENVIAPSSMPHQRQAILLAVSCILLLLAWTLWRASEIVSLVRRRLLCPLIALSKRRMASSNEGSSQPPFFPRNAIRLEKGLEQLERELQSVIRSGRYGRLIVSTLVLRFVKYGSLYLLLLGVLRGMDIGDIWVSPFVAFAAFLSAEASASLPVSGIMGFGTYEAAWTFVLHVSGVELRPGLIVAIGLSIHIVTQIVSYTIGVFCLCIAASNRRRTTE